MPQGGHTIAKDGFVVDMAKLKHAVFNEADSTVTVGPGIKWSELIVLLNGHGMSPKTLQSYASFSVGGSVSVNAHGITNDCCIHECVEAFTLIKWDGAEVRVVSRSISPPWRSIRFRLALRTYAPWGVRVVSQTKSRKIPTRNFLPLFFASRSSAPLVPTGRPGSCTDWRSAGGSPSFLSPGRARACAARRRSVAL